MKQINTVPFLSVHDWTAWVDHEPGGNSILYILGEVLTKKGNRPQLKKTPSSNNQLMLQLENDMEGNYLEEVSFTEPLENNQYSSIAIHKNSTFLGELTIE